ncbi:hypothetical protein SRB17_62270 [Streptomyces sp. RB17]|uniref:hypothetical protein n=1 Tax=Streptomyces sp. RB17 TaxID=2585197 RepID=UPI001297CEA7|nr:hypothetical protein [Streptomyces sp. RB17]MQY38217.1 hypothetical protein [Streptomyces sp. RB17]
MSEQQIPVAPATPVPGPEATPVPGPPRDRRVLRAVLRWTAALVVFAVAGTSTAYGITRMARTGLPGLATRPDGRWDYPRIVRPPLPAGRPAPFAGRNAANVHYADLRTLVLPAPKGAKADPALAGDHGWTKPKVYLAEYAGKDVRDTLRGELTDHGLRHIAARGWTMPDGTRTRIYLLQFETALVAGEVQRDEFTGYDDPLLALRGAASNTLDASYPTAATDGNNLVEEFAEQKPYGAEQVRQAYITSGDVIALVVQSRAGGAKEIPFQQTVVLQQQLLD